VGQDAVLFSLSKTRPSVFINPPNCCDIYNIIYPICFVYDLLRSGSFFLLHGHRLKMRMIEAAPLYWRYENNFNRVYTWMYRRSRERTFYMCTIYGFDVLNFWYPWIQKKISYLLIKSPMCYLHRRINEK